MNTTYLYEVVGYDVHGNDAYAEIPSAALLAYAEIVAAARKDGVIRVVGVQEIDAATDEAIRDIPNPNNEPRRTWASEAPHPRDIWEAGAW